MNTIVLVIVIVVLIIIVMIVLLLIIMDPAKPQKVFWDLRFCGEG